jgi:hypothetical protein
MLTRYACGDVGFVTKGRTIKAFIRVAEIRGKPVEESDKHCPICRGSE